MFLILRKNGCQTIRNLRQNGCVRVILNIPSKSVYKIYNYSQIANIRFFIDTFLFLSIKYISIRKLRIEHIHFFAIWELYTSISSQFAKKSLLNYSQFENITPLFKDYKTPVIYSQIANTFAVIYSQIAKTGFIF